jgi:hypothetical protein
MKSKYSIPSCCISVVVALTLTVTQCAHAAQLPRAVAARQRAAAPSAPPPARIAAAHTIFLTNAGADPNFPIDSTEAYNDIYAALSAWGRFQLVNSAEQADLIFELHGISPVTGVSGVSGDVESYTSPAFQLSIRDPKTNVVLWTITSPVQLAGSRQKLARWVALSETNLISRIKVVAGVPLNAAESADLTTVPKTHAILGPLVLLGLAGGVVVTGALLYRHGVNKGKADQDAFCRANNIPLSMCAGG